MKTHFHFMVTFGFLFFSMQGLKPRAQDANTLFQQLRQKWEQINHYEADGLMKTKVGYLKIPLTPIKLIYTKPDQMKLQSDKGVSFLPKGVAMLNMNQLFSDPNMLIIDGGITEKNKRKLNIIKLVPNGPKATFVLSTLWVDPVRKVLISSSITTREQGTFEMDMEYGKYSPQGLPDQILFSFDARKFQLPKGLTFDFEPGGSKSDKKNQVTQPAKSTVLITLNKYRINQSAK
jgi:hypothetical protein